MLNLILCKMMKNVKYILPILLAVIFVFPACDNELDLVPEDDVSQNVIFTTSQGAQLAVLGLYSKCQDDDVLNGTPQSMGEWHADNVRFVGSFPTFLQVRDYTILANNTSIQEVWRDCFEVVMAANFVIDGVPALEEAGFEEADKNSLIAEARFMRALIYFNMANWFSAPIQQDNGSNDCLPIVDFIFTGSTTEFEIPRSSLSEVHAFIAADLDFAIANLSGTDRTMATRGAAQALKARLHLYRGEWSDAATLANTVIGDSNFELAGDYSFFQNEGSKEHIFTLVNTAADGQNSGEGFSGLFNPSPEGRGDAPFSDYLINAFDTDNDLRFTTLTEQGPDAQNTNSFFTTKYVDGITNADNAPVIRITEMYLTRAEANFRAGSSTGAAPLDDINLLRSRAGLADLSALSLDDILDERRKELCFEGHRRMDLLRNELGLRPSGDPNFADAAFGANKTIWPIPTRERDLNPLFTQNPGY
ncbi:RagB/SusD family nutrient uptake outer membrane protein [Marinifilum sp. JC070]|uniref:RagB/SusD family nutrient uptake outer membrane protein n=2 Tax=Marinifilum caeruleilacunae TaxID=2499076 RepID=A0ABX1WU58_9BACT|nr:RagB/SusD family nutrient uptake outer membrane protein [Marinifilum caeruleilacunae]